MRVRRRCEMYADDVPRYTTSTGDTRFQVRGRRGEVRREQHVVLEDRARVLGAAAAQQVPRGQVGRPAADLSAASEVEVERQVAEALAAPRR